MLYSFPIIRNLILLFILLLPEFFLAQTTVTYTSSGTFYVPFGVTSITVECYGAGGGGGGDGTDNSVGGSGGGGGAYARSVIAVTAGASYPYSIGAAGTAGSGAAGGNGGNTTFNTTTVVAAGGSGGGANGAAGGAGGTIAASTGDVEYAGGDGATSADVNGRGGGGSGGTASAGNTGGNQAGATAVTGGYAGGAGGTGDGAAGNAPTAGQYGGGGGGSGDRAGASEDGGAGLAGLIKITYTGVATTYTIGPTGDDYATITAVKTAIGNSGVDAPIIFELQTDYVSGGSEASETYPISFSSITGVSITNTITFRPATGVTGLVSDGDPGNTVALISLDNTDYMYFDGRAAGSGSSQWTIRNTNANATASNRASTFKFINDASNNKLTYLTIEADAYYTKGIIHFSTTSGSTGNDNNTISYCTIQNYSNTTYIPGSGIYSLGTSGNSNSGNIVEYCQFIDVFGANQGTNSGNISLSTYNTAWIIRYNDFYKNAGTDFVTAITNANGHAFIIINDGGTYTIQNNDLGGTAADVGGGTQYTIAGASTFFPIHFNGSAAAETNNIYSNKVSNINFTTTYAASALLVFSGIKVEGSGVFQIGNTSSEANTIGSTTAVGDIIVTNNGASTSMGFSAIDFGATGSSTIIKYNLIGGITLNGTRAAETHVIHMNSGSGTVTVDNNIIGSTVANNIVITSNSILLVIAQFSASTSTISNNTIRNIDDNATSASFYGIYNSSSPITISGNTLTGIATATSGGHYVIYHAGTTATITNNAINSITVENTSNAIFNGIYVSTASAVTASSNTVGNTTNNNMSLAGDGSAYGIYFQGSPTSITCNSNTVQEFNLTNTGTNTIFYGIMAASGTLSASSNTIQNIDNAGTVAGGTASLLIGIYCPSSSVTNSILSNTVTDLNATTTGAYSTYVRGIWCVTGSGNVKKNMVKNIVNKATTTPFTYGITLSSGSWSVHNNVVLLSNGGNDNNVSLNGIQDDSPTTNTITIYHNTVKISGTTTAAATTRAFRRTGAATTTVYNNIFQNTRTGTGTHYAYTATDVTTLTTDENYLEVTDDANYLGYWSATAYNYANWKTAFAGEDNTLNGTETINSTTGKALTTFVGANQGVDLFTGPGPVTDDKEGTSRDGAPWMGAFEMGVTLPIELLVFDGKKEEKNNELFWVTATELNNDFFTLEKTYDGESFEIVGTLDGAGNSNQYLNYSFMDYDVREVINYYRLKQTDFDGKFAYSNIITIDNRVNTSNKEVVMITNILGQEVNEYYRGVVIIVYTDGTSIKVIQ